jgi:hypothetical protein
MKKRIVLLSLILILLPVLVVAALQPGLKYGLIYLLEQQGADRVKLESARINPFSGQIRLADWTVEKGGKRKLQLSGLHVDIAMLELFNRKLVIEQLTLDKTLAAVEKHPLAEVLHVIGIPLPTAGGDDPGERDAKSSWQLSLQRLVIKELTLDVQHPLFTRQLHLQDVVFSGLDTSNPEQAVRVTATVWTEQARLGINGEVTPFAATRQADLQIALKTFGLPLVQPLLDPAVRLDGLVDAELRLTMAIRPDNSMTVSASGGGALGQISATVPGIQVSDLNLNWLTSVGVELDQHGAVKVNVDELQLEGLTLGFALTENGADGIAPGDPVNPDEPGSEEAGATAEEAGLRLVINSLLMKGENQLEFRDQRIEPEFILPVRIDLLRLENMDSGAPLQPAQLAFKVRVQDHGKINVKGEIAVFAESPLVVIKGQAKDIEMLPLSAYTVNAIGHSMASGQLSADFEMNIADNRLKVTDELTIRNLSLKPVNNEKTKEFLAALPMPLDSALSLLRDDENVIHLVLPVSGDLAKPDFDLQGVINKALGNALKNASMSYLKYALQPYGAALMVAEFAGKQIGKVNFDPVVYVPGTTRIADESLPYIEKLTSLLAERRKISLTLCSKAVPADREAMEARKAAERADKVAEGRRPGKRYGKETATPSIEPVTDKQLLALANKRSEQLKSLLVEQGKVEPGRLFLCESEVLNQADVRPTTLLSL